MNAASLKSLVPKLVPFGFTVDLYGIKLFTNITTTFLLTSKYCENTIMSLARCLKPIEVNVIEVNPGNEVFLCEMVNLRTENRLHTPDTLAYYYPGLPDFPFRRIVSMLLKIVTKVRKMLQRI